MLKYMESLAAESKKKPSSTNWEKTKPGISHAGCISAVLTPYGRGKGSFKNL